MKAKSLLSLLSIAMMLCACKKDLEPQVASESPASADATQPPTQNAPVAQMAPATPGQNVSTTMTPAQMTPAQPAKVAAGMNPAHGQPGHRCDIAVGAPLNSPAGKTPAQQPAMTVTPSQSNQQAVKITPAASGTPDLLKPPTAAPAATAPGMNPPHGQPGHRCDISVGAPLSSPPGNTPAAVKTEPAKAEPGKLQITTSEPGK